MHWWLILYLIGYGIFTFFWVREDLRDGGSKSFLAVELVSDACMVLVALGYWLLSIRSLLGGAAIAFYIAGLAWLFIAGARDLREHLPGPESAGVKVATAFAAVALYCLVGGPLLYWGFSYAVLGKTGGT